MKIAARFPVKPSLGLLGLMASLHIGILGLAVYTFALSWQSLVITVSLIVSGYFCWLRYRSLTEAPDDLCWSGENWLMQLNEPPGAILYLQLRPQSWTAKFAAVLQFSAGERSFSWLFTRAELGERGYSELTYLVKQNLLAQRKA